MQIDHFCIWDTHEVVNKSYGVFHMLFIKKDLPVFFKYNEEQKFCVMKKKSPEKIKDLYQKFWIGSWSSLCVIAFIIGNFHLGWAFTVLDWNFIVITNAAHWSLYKSMLISLQASCVFMQENKIMENEVYTKKILHCSWINAINTHVFPQKSRQFCCCFNLCL